MPRLLSQFLHGSLALSMLLLSALSGLRVVVEHPSDAGGHDAISVADGCRGVMPAFDQHDLIAIELPTWSSAPVGHELSVSMASASQVALAAPTDRLGSARGPRAP